jgi:uncharacterized RDD family membrane protein YckC
MLQGFDSGPPRALDISFADEPAIAPVLVSFGSQPAAPAAAAPRSRRVPLGPRLAGYAIDASLLGLFSVVQLAVASVIGRGPSPVELVLSMPIYWLFDLALSATAFSFVFMAVWGRTPGMAATGQRLVTASGARPRPRATLARACLSLLSAALALFGFVLAFFDPRGQTLHDKICGCTPLLD